jgi:hypothetical protein
VRWEAEASELCSYQWGRSPRCRGERGDSIVIKEMDGCSVSFEGKKKGVLRLR